MTLAHRVQVVILAALHLCLWRIVYLDVREWLRERAREPRTEHRD
jgi:hypothetical protein